MLRSIFLADKNILFCDRGKIILNIMRCKIITRSKIKKQRKPYDYNKGPNDPTYISSERAIYMYSVTQEELNSLRGVPLRNAFSSPDSKMTCYVENDVETLCRSKGRTPRAPLYPKSISGFSSIETKNTGNGNKKVIRAAIISNMVIFVAKGFGWYCTGSNAMLAETIHSAVDVVTQIILAFGAFYSTRAPSYEHPYGWTRAKHISSVCSSVGVLSVGTFLPIWEGIRALKGDHILESLDWALAILGISFLVEGCSLSVALKIILSHFRQISTSKIFSRDFLTYLRKQADPINVAVLVEDLVALVGVTIALVTIGLSYAFSSQIPDSLGSIIIGLLLGATAIMLVRRNSLFLLERSIDRAKREAIIDTIDGDKLVRSVHDVKATMLGDGTVKFKAEVNYDGVELAKSYLYHQDQRKLLKTIRKINTIRRMKKFTIRQTSNIMNVLGEENDRLEKKLRNKFPELRHIDLETL